MNAAQVAYLAFVGFIAAVCWILAYGLVGFVTDLAARLIVGMV